MWGRFPWPSFYQKLSVSPALSSKSLPSLFLLPPTHIKPLLSLFLSLLEHYFLFLSLLISQSSWFFLFPLMLLWFMFIFVLWPTFFFDPLVPIFFDLRSIVLGFIIFFDPLVLASVLYSCLRSSLFLQITLFVLSMFFSLHPLVHTPLPPLSPSFTSFLSLSLTSKYRWFTIFLVLLDRTFLRFFGHCSSRIWWTCLLVPTKTEILKYSSSSLYHLMSFFWSNLFISSSLLN